MRLKLYTYDGSKDHGAIIEGNDIESITHTDSNKYLEVTLTSGSVFLCDYMFLKEQEVYRG